MPGSLLPILLAEDNADDVELVRLMLKKCGILNPLKVVHDGEDAIAYLQGDDCYANRARYPVPALLLLDLRMPGIGGMEVLRRMKAQGISAVPTFILTGYEDLRQVKEAYELGIRSFLTKPLNEREVQGLICPFDGIAIRKEKRAASRAQT